MYHVNEGAGREGLDAKGASGRKYSHGHERFEHLDEGDAEVEVRRVAKPQCACRKGMLCHVSIQQTLNVTTTPRQRLAPKFADGFQTSMPV